MVAAALCTALDQTKKQIRLLSFKADGKLVMKTYDDAGLPLSAIRQHATSEDAAADELGLRSVPETVNEHRHEACGSFGMLWIDAICIDQSDETDKVYQVRMMSDIYSKADTVLVWLGTDRQDALAGIRTLDEGRQQGEWLLGVELYDSAIAPFFTAPYWSRAWIVQEFLLARNPVFVAGKHILPFRKYKDVLDMVYGFMFLQPRYAHDVLYERIRHQKYKEREQGPLTPKALEHAIIAFTDWECYNPLDKVYSLLGLFSGDFTYELSRDGVTGRVDLRADYSVTPEQLYSKLYWYLQPAGYPDALENLTPVLLGKPRHRWRHGTAFSEEHDPDNVELPASP